MSQIWIIGGGKFGENAAVKLGRKHPDEQLIVVERIFEKCRRLKGVSIDTVCMDGMSFLSSCLTSSSAPDWIVPAVPLHVAYLWIIQQLSRDFVVTPRVITDDILSDIPNPIRGKSGEVYMSIADFICPDNCSEPSDICTITRKTRPYSLFEHLEGVGKGSFSSVVIRSHQLAAGVGGYSPEMLHEAFKKVKNATAPILFSSACRCHGVMNAFSISKDMNR